MLVKFDKFAEKIERANLNYCGSSTVLVVYEVLILIWIEIFHLK